MAAVDFASMMQERKKNKPPEIDFAAQLAERKEAKQVPADEEQPNDINSFLESQPPIEAETSTKPFNVAALNPEQAQGEQFAQQEKKEGLPLGEALKEGVKNLPKSAVKQVSSLWDAISNPSQTWQGMKSLSKDIYKNQMEVALKDMGFDPAKIKFEEKSILEHIEETPALDAVVDDLEKTYGSYEGFKQAVANDPARVLIDLGSVVAPASRVVEGAATAAKLPGVAKVAETVAKGASLTEPVTASAAGAKQAVKTISELTGKALPKYTPTGMYKSAAKMSTKLSEAERNRLSTIALEAGIPPTLKGLATIDESIAKIDSKIASMIDTAQTSGKTMPIAKLFKDFEKLKSDARLSGGATEGIRAINRVKKSLQDANFDIKRGRLQPKDVQKLKQTIYKEINTHYDKVKNSPVKAKAKKAIARASKEYLEELLPEIKSLNKTDGDLIALRDAVKGPASRISNRDLGGIGTAIKAGAGAAIGGQVVGAKTAATLAVVGATMGVLDDPIVKAKLAIVIDKLQKKGINISPERAIYRLGLIQASKATQVGEE